MQRMAVFLVCVFIAIPAIADDWTGKSIKVKKGGLKLGRKLGNGLIRDGAILEGTKSYTIKSEDGTFLELDGGFIFKSEAEIIADVKPLPKDKAKDTDPLKSKGEWFGKRVLPRRDPKTIRMSDRIDNATVYWTPYNYHNFVVREERDGFLRLFDLQREGWVLKADMVAEEDAPVWWDRAVKQNPNDAFAWQMRAQSWTNKGEYENAIRDYAEAIRLQPTDWALYNNRCCARRDFGDFDNAIKDATESIRLKPDNAFAYSNRGEVWFHKKEYDKAISDENESIRLDPKFTHAYLRRSNVWLAKKEYGKAISDCTEAIQIDSKYVGAYINRGIAWNSKQEYDKAITDYSEAIRLNPKSAFAHNNRGNAWLAKKEYDEALIDYEEAIRLDPSFQSPRMNRRTIWSVKGDWDKLIAEHDGTIQAESNNAAAWNEMAWLRATCPDEKYRNGQLAVEYATKACELTAWMQRLYLDSLAAAYAEAGDFDKAVDWQSKSIDGASATEKADFESRLKLYQDKKPYRQPAPQ